MTSARKVLRRTRLDESTLRKWSKTEATRRGWAAERVDYFDHRTKRSHDLFGIFDLIGLGRGLTAGIQYTTSGNMAARAKKVRASLWLPALRDAGWLVLVWGWRNDGTLRQQEIR